MHTIELLDSSRHDRDAFDCGNDALNIYLRQTASQHIRKNISKTYALVDSNNETPLPKTILGYYSISLQHIDSSNLPAKNSKGLPEKAPVLLLGRLAVSKNAQKSGIGKFLLADVFRRLIDVSNSVGGIGLLVDAKDEDAARYYEQFGFIRTTEAGRNLFLPTETIRKASEAAAQ